MNKLVIGEIGDSFYPVMDGVSNVIKNYTEQLLMKGHEAYAIVPGYNDSDEYDKKYKISYTVRGKMLSVSHKMDPYGIVVFPKKIEKMKFDIIHTHSPFFAGHEALRIAKRKHIPTIATFHTFFKDDIDELVHNEKIEEFAINSFMNVYRKVDEVWTPSEGSKNKIYREYGYDGFIRVVQNGCDMPVPSEEEFQELRKDGFEFLGLPFGTPFFLYVGQHKDQKNLMLILEAMEILKNKNINCHMVFVGDGHKKADYEKWVEEHNLTGCVHFIGRITDRELLKKLYSAAYLFLFPSLYDTSCLVMREAAAFRLPVVFVKDSCTSEGIIDGEDGFIAGRTADEFASKLNYVVSNPKIRENAGNGAKTNIYRSWSDAVEEVESLYLQIIESKKKDK